MPSVSLSDLFSFDSFAHTTMFMVLCFLMIVGISKQYTFPKLKHYAIRTSLAISTLFGICIEILQFSVVPGRTAEIMDIVSNTIGCLLGIVLFKWIYTW
ncbi:VanZ family protein [Pontibacter fetidus]|uniref:VanZ family protein n=1 Tax=Pontibacter fetidus TaxID=2700082 RepID=A0A6B2HA23_9BACT|nr:VanZ family protein [Pontibacter fetidus]NDK57110.1 VanZ family protein [Pontibacter fetidus]